MTLYQSFEHSKEIEGKRICKECLPHYISEAGPRDFLDCKNVFHDTTGRLRGQCECYSSIHGVRESWNERVKAYEKIIVLQAKHLCIQDEINDLKPQAVKELKELGYSYDKICAILSMGKINVLEIVKGTKTEIKRRGKQSNEKVKE